MGDLRTVRWTRNDDDRLYVMQSDGIQVGWVDLVTGERHLVAAAMQAEVDAALSAYAEAVPGLPARLAESGAHPVDDRAAPPDLGGADPDGSMRPDPRTTRLGAWWRDGWR